LRRSFVPALAAKSIGLLKQRLLVAIETNRPETKRPSGDFRTAT
jgi:hypothetical protein